MVNAKIAAKLREKEYDSKRKKLIDDLARREREALGKQQDTMERNFEVFYFCNNFSDIFLEDNNPLNF